MSFKPTPAAAKHDAPSFMRLMHCCKLTRWLACSSSNRTAMLMLRPAAPPAHQGVKAAATLVAAGSGPSDISWEALVLAGPLLLPPGTDATGPGCCSTSAFLNACCMPGVATSYNPTDCAVPLGLCRTGLLLGSAQITSFLLLPQPHLSATGGLPAGPCAAACTVGRPCAVRCVQPCGNGGCPCIAAPAAVAWGWLPGALHQDVRLLCASCCCMAS
jgi:hypothetical protein